MTPSSPREERAREWERTARGARVIEAAQEPAGEDPMRGDRGSTAGFAGATIPGGRLRKANGANCPTQGLRN